MMARKVEDIYITGADYNEDIECLRVEFPLGDLRVRSETDEIDSKLGNYSYYFDTNVKTNEIDNLDVINYEEAIKTGFSDCPFEFEVEYQGQVMLLKDLLIAATGK